MLDLHIHTDANNEINIITKNVINFLRFFFYIVLFALYFNLLSFYIEISIEF